MADGLNDHNDILLILELFQRILIFLSFLVDALNLSRLILFASRGSNALCFLHWVFHRIEVLLFSIIVISANG